MDIAAINALSQDFDAALAKTKQDLAPKDFDWHPYGTLSIFHNLGQMLSGGNRNLLDRVGNGLIADICAADGDAAFFLDCAAKSAGGVPGGAG